MLEEVKGIITAIDEFLADKENFETVIDESGTSIQVFARNGDMTTYHGYELYLMKDVTSKLKSTLDFKIIKEDENDRFIVTTDAVYNMESYINSTNESLLKVAYGIDGLNTIFVGEKLAPDSRGDFSVLTAFSNGSWMRCDITKSELLYAAVNKLPLSQNENGLFWYQDLIDLNNKFFDEVEKI